MGLSPTIFQTLNMKNTWKIFKRVVVSQNADLGIGFDGDGDRLGLVDDKGAFLSLGNYTLMLLARDFLEEIKMKKY